MTQYFVALLESKQENVGEVGELHRKIGEYLQEKQALVNFGGEFWEHRFYHSNGTSVVLVAHESTKTLRAHIATNEEKFIDDLLAQFSTLQVRDRKTKKSRYSS